MIQATSISMSIRHCLRLEVVLLTLYSLRGTRRYLDIYDQVLLLSPPHIQAVP